MARLLTIDACTVSFRNALLASLRPEDEGLLLPQAFQSSESGVFKNCVFRLAGDSPGVNAAVFSPDWFTGVSLIQLRPLDAAKIDEALESETKRDEMLRALVEAIPSEVADPDLQVGPSLDCDELERDVEGSTWQCGLDGGASFVGIFAAEHSRAPESGKLGMNRVHKEYFLVCRAGAGVAASTFHARVIAAASKGVTLDAMFAEGGVLGAQALRRLANASVRNRHRILLAASDVLGLPSVESVGDQASRNKYRGAVADIDVVTNSLRRLDESARSTWQFCSGVDGVASKGLVTLSNAADGLVLFLSSTGEKRIALKNETWGAMPFSTHRLESGKQIVSRVRASQHAHPDGAWVRKRFGWKNRKLSSTASAAIPFSLWGSHDCEKFSKTFARELGVAELNAVRLRPELVCVAGVESGKLRALVGGGACER